MRPVPTGESRPVEIVLARGLIANLNTPACVVDISGALIYYNDAAGELLGVRFEEAGAMTAAQWSAMFVSHDEAGAPLALDELPLSMALGEERATHRRLRMTTPRTDALTIEISAFPIVGNAGICGAMAVFWSA